MKSRFAPGIPIDQALRRQLKVWQRYWTDSLSGDRARFARAITATSNQTSVKAFLPPQLSIIQSLGSSPTEQLNCKKHNLQLAIQTLQDLEVKPGQIFSFWHCVKHPTQAAGYREGRTILGEQVSSSIGGGLCQLSGLLYFLGLKAGLEILERHPHSRDIYTEATRFAPLGSDATVVYGYKDLRIQNILSFPISFRVCIEDRQIEACICASESIPERHIEFKTHPLETGVLVNTFRYNLNLQDRPELISSTVYPPLTPSSNSELNR